MRPLADHWNIETVISWLHYSCALCAGCTRLQYNEKTTAAFIQKATIVYVSCNTDWIKFLQSFSTNTKPNSNPFLYWHWTSMRHSGYSVWLSIDRTAGAWRLFLICWLLLRQFLDIFCLKVEFVFKALYGGIDLLGTPLAARYLIVLIA